LETRGGIAAAVHKEKKIGKKKKKKRSGAEQNREIRTWRGGIADH
jgi:hypothetical protein